MTQRIVFFYLFVACVRDYLIGRYPNKAAVNNTANYCFFTIVNNWVFYVLLGYYERITAHFSRNSVDEEMIFVTWRSLERICFKNMTNLTDGLVYKFIFYMTINIQN